MSEPDTVLTSASSRLYLSQILGKPIVDAQDATIARVKDLIVQFGDAAHPPVGGLVARHDRRDFYLNLNRVGELSSVGFQMSTFTVDLRPFERREGEVLLRRDILDKQLIDVDGRRVVRANDLELVWADGKYHLVGVDVSAQGILRRLGPAKFTGNLPSRSLIDWADVESFATQAPMVRLRVSQAGLGRLHPVEIAQIVEALSPQQGHEVIQALDDETAADTVQELDPDDAADLLELMDPEHAADILDEMELNDAADVLAEMTDADSDELLGLMGPEESADVRELLDFAELYDADTAAGLMTTDFVSVSPALTAAQCLAGLRALPDAPEPLYHLYLATAEVTPGRQPLVGVVALRDVVLADPSASLDSFREDVLLTVRLEEPARAVAHKMAEYNLATIPVIDSEGCILGVIHIDDAMDVLLPDLWSRRTRRLFS